MPILGIMASQISGHLWAPEGAYDALATVTLYASTASISFAGSPSGYKHLQIRAMSRGNAATDQDNLLVQFNGDTGANYNSHYVYGTGSVAAAGAETGSQTTAIVGRVTGANLTSGVFGVSIVDILDYTNTNKYTTNRTLCGVDNNGSGIVMLESSLWRNTAAVTSLSLTTGAGSFIQYSSFALYGVK